MKFEFTYFLTSVEDWEEDDIFFVDVLYPDWQSALDGSKEYVSAQSVIHGRVCYLWSIEISNRQSVGAYGVFCPIF